MYLDDVVTLDVETSGLDSRYHQITAAALVPLNGSEPLEVFIDHPDITWTEKAHEFFEKYRERWEAERVPRHVAFERVQAFFGGRETSVICGHNVGFDMGFLNTLLFADTRWANVSHRYIDTASIIQYRQLRGEPAPDTASLKPALEFFKVPFTDEDAHTAIGDARVTGKLLEAMVRG